MHTLWTAFARLFYEGGWVLYPIFLVSCWAWFIGLGKIFLYRKIRARRRMILSDSRKALTINFEPYSRFTSALTTHSPHSLQRAYADFLTTTITIMDKGLSSMSVCAVITPLLGLLGTICGMNEMFTVIGKFGFGSPTIMAHGISVALEATLTGLGAAVAIIFFHGYILTNRSKLSDLLYADQSRWITDQSLLDTDGAEEKGTDMRMQADYRLIPQENERPEINLAPFVDTIMILLIFFVVTANLYVETGIDVSKPKAASATTVGAKSVLVGVTREGTVHIYGRQVSPDMLRMMLEQEAAKQPDVNVVIIADRESSIGKAVEVMDQCNLAGVRKVSIAAGKEQ